MWLDCVEPSEFTVCVASAGLGVSGEVSLAGVSDEVSIAGVFAAAVSVASSAISISGEVSTAGVSAVAVSVSALRFFLVCMECMVDAVNE